MANFKQQRSSKFRHVYGSQTRREQWFENVRITRNTHDSDFCCVNPKFLAVVLESSGGGSFAVLDVNKPGRIDINCPKVCGHAGAVMDIKWNPFNDHIIASASEDSTVKLWTIPQEGLSSVLSDWTADLHGHYRKVVYLDWHPTAENVLMSVGFDKKIMIWNVDQAEPITSLPQHPDTIFSASWGRDGSTLASTCKDKKVRVLDARAATIAVEFSGHVSPKTSKCVFVNEHSVFTTGFSRSSGREYALWDLRSPAKPSSLQDLDSSSGIVLPYFDPDTNMVYMAGKGDGMIRYVEVQSNPSDVYFLSYYQSPLPQRGLGMMPKRGVNTAKNELTRFYKLHASKDLVEPLPMIAPRKAEGFQHDIYPPTSSDLASLSADEWTSGINRGPILLNLEDGSIMDKPRTSMSAAVQSPLSNLTQMPEITTYKAVSKGPPPNSLIGHTPHQNYPASHHQHPHQHQHQHQRAPPPTALRTSPDGFQSTSETNEMTKAYSAAMTDKGGRQPPPSSQHSLPSSVKNIQRLSMTFDSKDSHTVQPHHQPPSPISSAQSLTSLRASPSPSPSHHSSPSPTSPYYNQPMRTASCTVLNGVRNDNPPSPYHSETAGQVLQASSSTSSSPSPSTLWSSSSNAGHTTMPQPSSNQYQYYQPPPPPPPSLSYTTTPQPQQQPYPPTVCVSSPTPPPQPSSSSSSTPSWPSSSPSSSGQGQGQGQQISVSAVKLVLGSNSNPSAPTTTLPAASTTTNTNTNANPPSTNSIHVRKVWTPPLSPASSVPPHAGASPGTDSELKKAYFRQLGEIKSLQEQLSIKDKRIKDLEAELSRAMTANGMGPSAGESNC